MDELEDRERAVYVYVRRCIKTERRSPSLREICAAIGAPNPSSVQGVIDRLVEKGFLRKRDGARGLELVRDRSGGLPFGGDVAAGRPIPPRPPDEPATFDFEAHFGGPDLVVYRVRGRSMIDAHIQDGDYISVRRSPVAEPGETVVAMIDGRLTLKVLRLRGGAYSLHPKNGAMEPIPIDPADDARLLGVLVAVFHKVS